MTIAKVTDRDVKAIIDTDRDTTPFVEIAQLIVDELLATSGLSVNRQNAVCRYLAAHFCWISMTNGLVMQVMGGSKEVYKTFADKSSALGSSRYGETAMALDTTGKLNASMGNSTLKALFNVIPSRGNPPRWISNLTQNVPDVEF